MVDLLELGFLEADDGMGWLREGEADIVAFGGVTHATHIPGKDGDRLSSSIRGQDRSA